jgi:ferredoxin-thioredoxin reductase catalytic subunit
LKTEKKEGRVPCDPSEEAEVIGEKIRRWTRTYAAEHGWILNPDSRALDIVIRGLTRNCKKFGHPYCPCRLRSGDPEKDRDIVCPCIFHEDEVRDEGNCHCRLFFRPDKDE